MSVNPGREYQLGLIVEAQSQLREIRQLLTDKGLIDFYGIFVKLDRRGQFHVRLQMLQELGSPQQKNLIRVTRSFIETLGYEVIGPFTLHPLGLIAVTEPIEYAVVLPGAVLHE